MFEIGDIIHNFVSLETYTIIDVENKKGLKPWDKEYAEELVILLCKENNLKFLYPKGSIAEFIQKGYWELISQKLEKYKNEMLLTIIGDDNMFKKEDLKAGYLIELESGELCIINYNNRDLLGIKGVHGFYNDIFCIKNDFSVCNVKDCGIGYNGKLQKIMKVFGRTANGFLDIFSTKDRLLLWERKEDIEMTISEIEEKLGIKNLKIVKEND